MGRGLAQMKAEYHSLKPRSNLVRKTDLPRFFQRQRQGELLSATQSYAGGRRLFGRDSTPFLRCSIPMGQGVAVLLQSPRKFPEFIIAAEVDWIKVGVGIGCKPMAGEPSLGGLDRPRGGVAN